MERKANQILFALKSLHDFLKQKSEKFDQETQTVHSLTGLCKMPRKVLGKIFLFLDPNKEILIISGTCKYLNTFLSSYYLQRQFYKNLVEKFKPKSESVQSESEIKQADIIQSSNREEILQKFQKNLKFHELLRKTLEKSESKSREIIQNINKLNDELRIQKQINSKTLTKKNTRVFESQEIEKEILKLKSLSHQETSDQSDKIFKLTEQIKKIETEKNKVRSHAKILQIALEDARADHQVLGNKLRLLKENLFKLKNYCNEMLEPKIQKILSTS